MKTPRRKQKNNRKIPLKETWKRTEGKVELNVRKTLEDLRKQTRKKNNNRKTPGKTKKKKKQAKSV